MNKKTIFALLVAGIILMPSVILAADAPTALKYSPPYISGVPGFDKASTEAITTNTAIQAYLVRIYQFAIGISGITAVGMIVWGAINMSIYTGRIDRYEEGKTMIYQALFGLVLLFGSYLLLQTINPEIVQLKEPGGNLIPLPKATSTAAGPDTKSSCGGGDLSKIQFNPSLGPTEPAAKGCEYRRLKLTSEVSIPSNALYSGKKTIPAGSIVWLWPYYENNFGPEKSAKCVVYAYKVNTTTTHEIQTNLLDLDKIGKCGNDPSLQKGGAECAECGGGASSGATSTSASGAEAELLKHSVTLHASGDLPGKPCRDRTNTSCTSLDGMPSSAISYLSNLGDWCFNNNCEVVVTGGTEDGHRTHCVNNPVFDLKSTGTGAATLGQHLLSDPAVNAICTSYAQRAYRKECNYSEGNDHFHVQLPGAVECPK